jgi:hypothetical protein
VKKSSSDIGVTEAAARLGLTPQAVRDRIRAGVLPGGKDERGRWRMPTAAVPSTPSAPPGTAAIVARLEQLSAEVSVLRDAQARDARLVDEVSAQRDRYRADAASAREVALRLNVAVAEIRASARSLLDALDAQSDALTELLAPGSPADLP